MAKKSVEARQRKRERLVKKFEAKRKELKEEGLILQAYLFFCRCKDRKNFIHFENNYKTEESSCQKEITQASLITNFILLKKFF